MTREQAKEVEDMPTRGKLSYPPPVFSLIQKEACLLPSPGTHEKLKAMFLKYQGFWSLGPREGLPALLPVNPGDPESSEDSLYPTQTGEGSHHPVEMRNPGSAVEAQDRQGAIAIHHQPRKPVPGPVHQAIAIGVLA